MQSRKNKLLWAAAIILFIAALALIGVYCAYRLWEQAPVPLPTAIADKNTATKKPEDSLQAGLPIDTERNDDVYTILLAGSDNGTGNTDAIMVGRIDAANHTMNFVSIPRDTIVNRDWGIRKINSVYWGSKNNGGDGAADLKMHARWLLGFDVDCYAVIDLSAFVDTIDALGGVDVNVKQAIDYEDPAQNIYIHVAPGEQHLSGYDSMCYVRYRAGYITGDLGRIDTQHDFLKDMAKQFLTLGSIPNASKVVDILSERTDTNLSAANIAFLMRQALKCKSEDINFYTMPNTADYCQGYSYAFPALWEWLTMVNDCLNPYRQAVGPENLNMIYMSNGTIGCTGVMQGAWYFEKPPEPTPTPEPTATTEPTSSAEPTTTPESSDEPVITPGPTIITIEPSPTAEGESGSTPEESASTPVPTEEPGVTPSF